MFRKSMHRALTLVGAVAILGMMGLSATACNDAPSVPIDEVVDAVNVERMSSQGSNQIDVLFVVANSTSMDAQQRMLERAFPTFVRGLLDLGADFHIGVITTDMNQKGELRYEPGDSADYTTVRLAISGADSHFAIVPAGQQFTDDGSLPGNGDYKTCDGGGDCVLQICDGANEHCVICDEDGTNCKLQVPADPSVDLGDAGTDVKSVPVTCGAGEIETPEGGPETAVSCEYATSYCTEPPGNLVYCNDRFVPLLNDEGEQASCTYDGDQWSYDSFWPSWQRRADDVNNSDCNAVEGPRGTRRCTPQGTCEIMAPYLRTADYQESDGSVEDDAIVGDFACLSSVGTCNIRSSTTTERGLDAVYEALQPGSTFNDGFLRDDAILLIVIVSDGDDCSVGYDDEGDPNKPRTTVQQCWGQDAEPLMPTKELYDFLTTKVKRSPSQVMAAAIVGPITADYEWEENEYTCSRTDENGETHTANAGVRYTDFVHLFGGRGVIGSICNTTFEPILNRVTRTVSRSLGQTCLTKTPKVCDPTQPGSCGPGVECVQAAPPRVLMHADVEIETGRDDATKSTKEGVDCPEPDDPEDAKFCETTCQKSEDCFLEDGNDDNRVCASNVCGLGGNAIACTTDADCVPSTTEDGEEQVRADTYVCDNNQCYNGDLPTGTSPRFLCDDFRVRVSKAPEGSDDWEEMTGPGKPDDLNYNDDRDFEVNYYASDACTETGISYHFVHSPGVSDKVRISYPVSLRDQIFQ